MLEKQSCSSITSTSSRLRPGVKSGLEQRVRKSEPYGGCFRTTNIVGFFFYRILSPRNEITPQALDMLTRNPIEDFQQNARLQTSTDCGYENSATEP